MSTKDSPLWKLKEEARRSAQFLKAAERGEVTEPKIVAARKTDRIKTAIAMDDKMLILTLTWEEIRRPSLVELTEFILAKMREEKAN